MTILSGIRVYQPYSKRAKTENGHYCTERESDDPSVTFTAANIAQQKAAHNEASRAYLGTRQLNRHSEFSYFKQLIQYILMP